MFKSAQTPLPTVGTLIDPALQSLSASSVRQSRQQNHCPSKNYKSPDDLLANLTPIPNSFLLRAPPFVPLSPFTLPVRSTHTHPS